MKTHFRFQSIFLVIAWICTIHELVAQNDTYLQRETFGLISSIGWDIQEYDPGKYLTLLDGRVSNDSEHVQIGFLGKHESNGIVFIVDSLDFGPITLGLRPKLYKHSNKFFTYTKGTSHSYVIQYDLSTDSTSVILQIDSNDGPSRFSDISPLNEDEILALYAVEIENSAITPGNIFRVQNGEIRDLIVAQYPESFKFTLPRRIIYNKNTNTFFLLSTISEEIGQNLYARTHVQEYSMVGEILREYTTPIENFHIFTNTNFEVSDSGRFVYLGGQGSDDFVGWVIKIDMENATMDWKQVFTESDFSEGNKQGLMHHIQKIPDEESLIVGGAFFSNDISANRVGFISKISLEGELLWTRTYKISDGLSDETEIRSIRPTSDGGYIAMGRSVIRNGGSDIAFATVILKVDRDGLVDGISSSTEDSPYRVDLFTAFPNPASSILSIKQRVDTELTYRLTDNFGQQLDYFDLSNGVTEHNIDVSTYPAGNYVITVSDSAQILKSEIIVIAK